MAQGAAHTNPAAPRRGRRSKSGRRGPREAGEPRAATHPGARGCPGPSGALSEADRRRQRGRRAGGGGIAGRERVEVAEPARPPRRRVSRALPLGLRSSPSAPRRLPGGGRPAGDQWGPRGRAGGTAHPPPSCRAWPALRVVRRARCSSLLSAPGSRARSTAHTAHTPHTPTHPTPTR